jgi:nicotinate-nucleotide adenylyltransferase
MSMVELACREDARFEASRLEQGTSPSYSVETIARVRGTEGVERPYFVIGADAFAEIGTWYRWREVVDAATFIVVSRPGATYAVPEGAIALRLEDVALPISSSEIRRLAKEHSADLPVPLAVAEYIERRGLYR